MHSSVYEQHVQQQIQILVFSSSCRRSRVDDCARWVISVTMLWQCINNNTSLTRTQEKRRLFDRYHEDAFCELDDLEVKRLVTLYNSMQMTLRSSRRVAHNSNSSNNRDRPLSSHTGVGHHHASSSSSSSSTGASVAMRNFQLRRANSSNLNCYTSSVCAPAIMSSASSNDRRRSINQLTRGDYESACVTLRRTNSTNLTPDARTKSSDVTLNVHHHHTNSNDVSHLRPSSTPAHSMMGERRRRQLPQCPQAYRWNQYTWIIYFLSLLSF